MHSNYARRRRPNNRLRLLWVLGAALIAGSLLYVFTSRDEVERPVAETGGIKRVSTVKDADIAVWDGERWRKRFWNGVNLGATLPGHAPGELAPTKEYYLKWFSQMKEMNVDVLRVYTILSPGFYEAVEEFNSTREDPLWVIQGIWSPEEALIGADQQGRNAYTPEITREFEEEIKNAVRAVHGDAEIEPRKGHAGGTFDADISRYVLGWIVGTEWFPYAVQNTDRANAGMAPFSGEYFRSTADATPFESWLASMLETLAQEEMRYGWQHPVAFTNWLTTDPLSHPDEANPQEDLISVDPMNLEPTGKWKAGYFASYHVYPYYPDFLRYEKKYREYVTPDGRRDPYAGYLNELRAYHRGIPLVVAEFGVPGSRGMAHRGPLGRDQGLHTEEEQGRIDAGMLRNIRQQGYDGGILFSWQDEWFKLTWNTADIDMPPERRPMWLNRLTNEQNFGVIANEAGKREDAIYLDGKTSDWEDRPGVSTGGYPGLDLSVAHDEAYVYLLARKKSGDWSFPENGLTVGFGNGPGGSEVADAAPGLRFPGGIQFLLKVRGAGDSRILVNSAYDYHTWLYGKRLDMIPKIPDGGDAAAGRFLPWRLALSRPITLPRSGRKIPFEDFEVGLLKPGVSDPSRPDYNSLADWYAAGDVLEVRIPWTLLGYTDPSSKKAWANLYEAGEVKPVDSPGLRVYPSLDAAGEVEPLVHDWRGWDEPDFHERKKRSYYILREAYRDKRLQPIPQRPTADRARRGRSPAPPTS